MRQVRFALLFVASLMLAGGALAQSPSATPVNTSTAVNTSTLTPVPTRTPTTQPAVPTLNPKQLSQINDFSPGAKWANLGGLLVYLTKDANDSVKVQVLAGVDGSAGGVQNLGLFDRVADVVAVLAFTTSSGAAASKTLLAPTTDYIVAADGTVECVTNQSANTLLVVYHRK